MLIEMLKGIEEPRARLIRGREYDLTESRATYLIAQGLARPIEVTIVTQKKEEEKQTLTGGKKHHGRSR